MGQNIVKLVNVKLPKLPIELRGSFDVDNWFRVYINGEFIPPANYTYRYEAATKEIYFTFTNLGFSLDENDEVAITGKFIEL
jgi:hypothetical protein